MPLTINPELQSLIPSLTPEEYAQLEANIVANGCRDALVVWQEEQTLLDGHNRQEICERHDLPYTTHAISLPDLDAARTWIIANQLGRRNLTPDQMSYFRGKHYDLQKQQGKRTDLTSAHFDQKFHTTAAQLAQQHKVSEATIRRDAAYAHSVDTIAEIAGPEARQALLARETKITQQEVKQLADVAKVSPPTVQHVMAGVRHAKTPHVAKQMVHTAVEAVQKEIAQVGSGNLAEAGVPRAVLDRLAPTPSKPILTQPLDVAAPVEAPSTGLHRVSTGDYEWYTPQKIVRLVRQTLGVIDVDPASCAAAQEVIQARTFYTVEDDGLRHPWHGTVFLNPPYKMPEVARFVGKLLEELAAGHTTAAILLVNAATETDWFQTMAPRANALCFPDGRLHFSHATHNGESPCHGQAILYFGSHVARFCEVFAAMGVLLQVLRAKAAGPQLDLAEAPVLPSPQEAPVTRETAGSLIQAVWLTVQRLQPCTNAEVKTALGEPRNTVYHALQDLVQQGRARQEGKQYWVIDAPGASGDE